MRNYATQMDAAKRGIVTPEIETVAKKENRPVEFIMERVAKGTIAIPANINHKSLSAEAVGDGTRVKINVNLGISGDCKDYEMELRKVRMAVDMGAESIMDLSNYGKTNTFRKQLIDMSPAMIGTVPMYDAIGYLEKDLLEITAQDFLKVVEAHAREGVDFMTIHAGINRRAVEAFMREGRKMNIVSRGGSLLFAWMKMTGNENPFFEYYDEVLDILRRYDVTISLGDALRPGCIDDASDAGQISELIELGNLAQRAWAKDVQVMIEGPGHMAMNEIAANMQMEKRLCHGAPFYVLGPLVTDIAPGYDHITSAIGGAIAAQAARTSCATLPRQSICACRMKMTCARASSPARSRHTRRISPSVCRARATATTRWRTRVISWTGPRSSRWHSTRKRPSGSIIRFRRPSAIPARCAAKCAPCVPQI